MTRVKNAIIIGLIFYFIVCYGEILIKNTRPNPEYSKQNFIVWFVKGVETE